MGLRAYDIFTRKLEEIPVLSDFNIACDQKSVLHSIILSKNYLKSISDPRYETLSDFLGSKICGVVHSKIESSDLNFEIVRASSLAPDQNVELGRDELKDIILKKTKHEDGFFQNLMIQMSPK